MIGFRCHSIGHPPWQGAIVEAFTMWDMAVRIAESLL